MNKSVWQWVARFCFLGLVFWALGGSAQAGDLGWGNNYFVMGFDGEITAVAVFQGDLYVGGRFQYVDGKPLAYLARWTGAGWEGLPESPNGPVLSLYAYDGGLYAGGEFGLAGGASALRVARWDGSAWSALGSGASGPVTCFGEYGGALIVGGTFATIGGTAANNIARWDGSSFSALESGTDRNVADLIVFNGDLIATGDFSVAGGIPANSIARWNGLGWDSLAGGLTSEEYSVARGCGLAVYDNALYVVGTFRHAGGFTVNGFTRWTGSEWQFVAAVDAVNNLDLLKWNDRLIVAGRFHRIGSLNAGYIASYQAGTFSSLGKGLGGPVYSTYLAEYDGDLIAVGTFTTADSIAVNRIARWNGSAWSPMVGSSNALGVTGDVTSFAVYEGDLIVGGRFTTAGGASTPSIARFDGAVWSPIGFGMDGDVEELSVVNGELYAGGSFNNADLNGAHGLAKWNGAEWRPVGAGVIHPWGSIYTITEFNGELVIGGSWTLFSTGAVTNLGRWDGSSWRGFGVDPDGTVYDAVEYNGELIAAGSFLTIDGHYLPYIARWDGTAWHPLGSGVNGTVRRLHVHDNKLYAAGSLTAAGGVPVNNVACWDGTAWNNAGDGLGHNTTLGSLATVAGELYLGGRITDDDGYPLATLVRWDGYAWVRVDSADPLAAVLAITEYNNSLFLGGSFNWMGDTLASNISHWFADPDGDGLYGAHDNCTFFANPDQADTDGDGRGNACWCVIRGNVDNQEGEPVTVGDLTYLVSYLFRNGLRPPLMEQANVDASPDGRISVRDLTDLVSFLFRGGEAPPPCYAR